MTIRKRLTLWFAGLLTLIIVIFGAITYGVMRVTMIDNLDKTLLESARQVAINSRARYAPTFGSTPRVDVELAAIPSLDVFRASNVYVQAWEIVNGQPELKDSSANITGHNQPLDPHALGVGADHFGNVTIVGTRLRVLTRPIFIGDRVVGNIQVAASLETINQASDTLLFVMLVSCGAAILGATALSMWFSHRALKPIEDITQAASSIAGASDLSTRLAWDGPHDELGRLISVFNLMMGRIDHLFSVQQRFVADVSHELRTPLTAIRGNMDIIKRYGMDDSSLDAIEVEAERMSRLVNDLLMLARADYGGLTVELVPIDLDSVVLEALRQSKRLAQGRDLHITLAHVEPMRINGNADRIQQVIANLITNAIKFTPDGGHIEIALRRAGQNATISVSDTGIGIPPGDLDRIFDRFYQIETARTHTGGGFGLGLSIAKWIVEVHGGRITAQSEPGQGSIFIVALPLYDPEQHTPSHEQPTRPRIPVIRRAQAGVQAQHHIPQDSAPHES